MEQGGDRIFVAGGAGFIGSAFVRHLLAAEPTTQVHTYDLLTYAGHRINLDDLPAPHRHDLTRGDIADPLALAAALDAFAPTAVVNLAAETHVDRSLREPAAFVRTNVLGAQVLVDACRARSIRLLHVSTDEVYGSLPEHTAAGPQAPLAPTSPYAASKAAGDLMVQAAHRSHGQDVVITRCTNNYGPRQIPEKLVPLMILRAQAGETLPVYGDGLHVRDWLHVDDHAAALRLALRGAPAGTVVHVAGRAPRTNLEMVETLRRIVGREEAPIRHVADRPGHDRRYALDDAATREDLGWSPEIDLAAGLEATVGWYREHAPWCAAVAGEDLRAFLRANYADRLAEIDDPADG